MMKQQATIKFGAHQFIWKSHWTDGDLHILDTVRWLGLGQFEVSLGDDVQFDRRRLRKKAEMLGVELTVGPGNLWPMNCDISDDDAGHRELGMAWPNWVRRHTVAHYTAIPGDRAAAIRLRMNSLARRKTCTSSLITLASSACGW
jgi:hypothetical protein